MLKGKGTAHLLEQGKFQPYFECAGSNQITISPNKSRANLSNNIYHSP